MASGKRFYDENEAEQILRLASRKAHADGSMSREQLLANAAELGISARDLAAAEHEFFEVHQEKEDRALYRKEALGEFWSHFGFYATVNAGLLFFDLIKDGRLTWALWPLLGWGLAIVGHAIHVNSKGPEQEREFQKWRRKKNRKRKPKELPAKVEEELITIADEFDTEKEKIEAIRELRERTGLSLKEAKEAVEQYNQANG